MIKNSILFLLTFVVVLVSAFGLSAEESVKEADEATAIPASNFSRVSKFFLS